MKVDQAPKRGRGRPKRVTTNRRKKSSLPSTTATSTAMVVDNPSSVEICSNSSSSPEKSIIDVVSLSDTITTDVSDSSCVIQRKVSDRKTVDLKEVRIVLENILHSKLVSPKQRTELLNRSYNTKHSTTRSVPKKKRQRKKKSKPISISSTTSGSSVIFLGNSTPKVTDMKFNPKLTLTKIKVESPQKISETKTFTTRRLLNKNSEEQSLNKKAAHTQKKLEGGFSNARKSSKDRPISIHGSSSSEQLESIERKTESKYVKRDRSETSCEGRSSFNGSLKEGISRVKKSTKRRKRNSSKVKSRQNTYNEDSKRTPKKNDTVDGQHIDNSCSFVINDSGNGNCSDEPPILSPINIRIASPLVCHNRAEAQIRANDRSPLAVCVGKAEVEIRPDYKLTQTSFASSETEVGLCLDEKHCCLDSIAQAIENDLAAGNRLSPLGDIENMVMPPDLPNDTCCLRKMIINDSTTADHPESLQQDKEKSRNVSERGSDSHETSSNISSSTSAPGSDRKRKRPTIINEDILPKGTISVSKNGKKKQRLSSPTVVSDATTTNQKMNQNSSTSGNNAEYIFIDQSVVNLPSSLHAWSKSSEIEPLLQEHIPNDRLSEKHGCIIDDALNNNQEVNFVNKNTLNSEKQEEKMTLHSSASVVSPDFEEEFDALHGLLTNFADNNDPNSITEIDNYPDLADNVTDLITKVDDTLELDNDREVDEAIESFTASVNWSRNKNIRDKEKAPQVASLTVDNVDKFDCAASGSQPTVQIASPVQSFGTDSSRDWQSEDMTECSSSSVNVRRRRWIPGEDAKSSPAQSRKIRLNRGNWSTNRKEQSEISSVAVDSSAEPKNSLVTSKNAAQNSNKNDNKFELPQSATVATVSYNNFRKPSSPTKYVQKRDNIVRKTVPGFGEGAIYGVPVSKSETDRSPEESSESCSSGSESDSSSSSSTTSDSESSDDEVATKNVVEKVTEKIPEEVTAKVNEYFFQRIPQMITNRDPRNVTSHAEKSGNMGGSVFKSKIIRTAKGDKPQFVLEKAQNNEKAAGSLIDNDLGNDKKDEDEDDCISLFADSSCMSRCDSPPLNEPSKRRRSPLYKQMKSSNIDSFANANNRQCDEDIAAYREQVINSTDNERQQQNKNDKKTANEPRPNKDSIPSLDPRNKSQIRPTVQAENKPDLRSTLNGKCELEPKYFFFGQCYGWLKFGKCNQPACRYLHVLKPQLQRINSYQTKTTEGIVEHAVANRYYFFLGIVHSQVVVTLSTEKIIHLYQRLYNHQCLSDIIIESTTKALIQRGMPLKEIVTTLDSVIVAYDEETPNGIIRAVFPRITEPGALWETLGKVISKISPSVQLVEKVIEECIYENKSKEHCDDVYEHLIKGLPVDFLPNIRANLFIRFHDYHEKSVSFNTTVVNNVEPQYELQQNGDIAYSIASPDSISYTLPEELTEIEKSKTALTFSPEGEQSKTASGSASRRSFTSSQTSGYSIAPIDNLPPPQSLYRVVWKFRLDLQGVQEGLKHRDYTHVISILEENVQHPSRLPHMEGFYNILCNEIMSSKHHLAEIVRRTVQSGASNDLRQFVFDLGVYVLTKLADIGAWVLAHELLKTFQVYGTYNTCAYTLLAVEIYIANYRPLKALELLKQSQLIFTNTKVWNQMRCPNDEPLRVAVMQLLLSSLCDGHAQHALSLFEFILNDQCSSFKPINVSRYVDKIARALLAEKHTSSIIDFGRLIIQANLSPTRSTFRALINSIFHNDRILAKQLHRYATWLGAYNTAKISRTTHMVINNDWTEEEMFLMFSALIKDLSTNIGHAIGRLRPRQLAVFLILETIPTEKHLYLDRCNEPMTNTAISKRKAILRNVLEHFDPKIKLVQRSQGRLCKVQSASLVDYLKAGHFED